jgi:ribosomal protein S18 acetylase RimI-like enzyme
MKNATKAVLEDATAILQLQKLAFYSEAEFYGDFDIPPLTQTLEELTKDFTSKSFFKVEIQNQIVGSVRGYKIGDTCHIERLIVHPDYQGKGIGTVLMKQIELCFDDAQRFELFTGYKSERNIKLYQRLGYKIFKSEKVSDRLSFVFMEKHR